MNKLSAAVMGAGLIALSISGPLQAQDTDNKDDSGPISTTQAHSKGAFVESYDANGDGVVSKAEFMASRKDGYDLRDADGDGTLIEAEYVGEYIKRLDRELKERRMSSIRQAYVRFDVLDTDENKEMTLEEFNDSGLRMFKRLDTNEDGVVNEEDSAEHF